jgi:hypothetical protein
MQLARMEPDPKDKQDLLDRSLQLFIEVADDIAIGSICSEYQHQKFYTGVVRLALAHAAAVDPLGIYSKK